MWEILAKWTPSLKFICLIRYFLYTGIDNGYNRKFNLTMGVWIKILLDSANICG